MDVALFLKVNPAKDIELNLYTYFDISLQPFLREKIDICPIEPSRIIISDVVRNRPAMQIWAADVFSCAKDKAESPTVQFEISRMLTGVGRDFNWSG